MGHPSVLYLGPTRTTPTIIFKTESQDSDKGRHFDRVSFRFYPAWALVCAGG